MAPTKSQAITAAATFAVLAASFGPASAAPFTGDNELTARGPNASRIAGAAAKEVYTATGQSYMQGKVKDALKQDPKVPQGLKDAAAMATKPKDPKLVAAATKLSAVNAFKKAGGKKRDLADLLEEVLEARDLDELEELFARGPQASRLAGAAAKEVYTATGQSYMQGKVKDALKQDPKVPQGLKDAAAMATKPKDPKLVAAATKISAVNAFKKAGGKKRDLADILDEVLEAREYFDELDARELYDELDELFARGPQASRIAGAAAKEVYTATGQSYMQGKVKDALKQDPKVPQGLKDAAAMASKPKDPKLVAAATKLSAVNAFKKAGGKKRDLADILEEVLEAREYYDEMEARDYDELEEIFARGPTASRVAGSAAKEVYSAAGQNYIQGKINDATRKDPKVPQGLKDAAAMVNKPKNPALVAAATKMSTQKPKFGGGKKRDLADLIEEALEARDYDELEELFARGPTASRVAGSAAKEAYSAAGQNYIQGKINDATRKDPKVPQGLKDAAAMVNKPKNPALVAAATKMSTQKPKSGGGKKRDLADLIDEVLEARELYDELDARDYDELEDLFARGPNASKIAGAAAKEVYTATGQSYMQGKVKDALKQDTKVPQGLKDAAAMANKPKNPKLVAAATKLSAVNAFKQAGKKKRDLADLLEEALEAREMFFGELEELD